MPLRVACRLLLLACLIIVTMKIIVVKLAVIVRRKHCSHIRIGFHFNNNSWVGRVGFSPPPPLSSAR